MLQLIILDRNFDIPCEYAGKPNLAWRNSCANDHTIRTVVDLVEADPKKYRKIYLEWIHDIGRRKIGGKSIIDWLHIENNFSLWWFTKIYQKSNFFDSPYISDVIKLIALEAWIESTDITSIILISDDKRLAVAVASIAEKHNYTYRALRSKNASVFRPQKLKIQMRRLRIYQCIRALKYFLVRIWSAWPLTYDVGMRERLSSSSFMFVSHFANFTVAKSSQSGFLSSYWGGLPEHLLQSNSILFVHLYYETQMTKSGRDALRQLNLIRKECCNNALHIGLESFLSLKILVRSLSTWFFSIRMHSRFLKSSDLFRLSGIDFSAYFKDDWDSSFIGAPALMNIVYFFLFEKLMHVSSIESAIVFLQENQPWERSLVYWSENQGFSNTVGVAHSSVRFWDLRYYHSSKDLCGTEIESQVPMPSITAVNGPLAKQQFLQSGFPSQKLREVEALRYEYLNYNDLHEFTNIKSDKALVGDELTLVILGDYNETDTSVLLAVVDQAMGCLSTRMRVRFKGHPLTKISLKQFPNLKGCAFNGSLDAALDEASIVITGCLTTGAVDAASRGLPVVSVLDDSALNLSPLLGCSGVSFVANADDLVRALNDPRQLVGHDQSNFFFFSDNYSGWKNLFNVLESRRDQSNL